MTGHSVIVAMRAMIGRLSGKTSGRARISLMHKEVLCKPGLATVILRNCRNLQVARNERIAQSAFAPDALTIGTQRVKSSAISLPKSGRRQWRGQVEALRR